MSPLRPRALRGRPSSQLERPRRGEPGGRGGLRVPAAAPASVRDAEPRPPRPESPPHAPQGREAAGRTRREREEPRRGRRRRTPTSEASPSSQRTTTIAVRNLAVAWVTGGIERRPTAYTSTVGTALARSPATASGESARVSIQPMRLRRASASSAPGATTASFTPAAASPSRYATAAARTAASAGAGASERWSASLSTSPTGGRPRGSACSHRSATFAASRRADRCSALWKSSAASARRSSIDLVSAAITASRSVSSGGTAGFVARSSSIAIGAPDAHVGARPRALLVLVDQPDRHDPDTHRSTCVRPERDPCRAGSDREEVWLVARLPLRGRSRSRHRRAAGRSTLRTCRRSGPAPLRFPRHPARDGRGSLRPARAAAGAGRIRKSEAIATKRTGRGTMASRRAGSTKPP